MLSDGLTLFLSLTESALCILLPVFMPGAEPLPPSDSTSSADGRRPSCRVCSDEEELFSKMRHKLYAEALKKDGSKGKSGPRSSSAGSTHKAESNSTAGASPRTPSAAARAGAAGAGAAAGLTSAASASPSPSPSSSASPSFLAAGRPLPCPPDATRLGRATWTFLHSMAAYFPTRPSPVQSQQALALLHSLPHLYPCPHCAAHLSSHYQQHRPEDHVQGREQLGLFLCRVHNDVRERQGKRMFDCNRWRERWGGQDWDDLFGEERTKCREQEYADVEEEDDTRESE